MASHRSAKKGTRTGFARLRKLVKSLQSRRLRADFTLHFSWNFLLFSKNNLPFCILCFFLFKLVPFSSFFLVIILRTRMWTRLLNDNISLVIPQRNTGAVAGFLGWKFDKKLCQWLRFQYYCRYFNQYYTFDTLRVLRFWPFNWDKLWF